MTFTGSAPFKVSVLLLLCLGTVLFFNLYDRYVVVGAELITNGHFSNNLAKWRYSERSVSVPLDEGIVRLSSENPAVIVDLSQSIPDAARYSLLRFSCAIKTSNVPPGQVGWNSARVVLASHDQKGIPMWNFPHLLTALRGTHDWEYHEGVFAVAPNATSVSVTVQLAQTTGTIWVKNLSLRPLAERASFQKFRRIATFLWAAASLWIAVPLVRSAYGRSHNTAIIVLALVILLGVLMPESLKEHIGSSLFPSLTEQSNASSYAAKFNFTPLLPAPDIYKAGHFFLFTFLAIVAFHRRPYPASRVQMLGYLLLFSLVTEILQLLVTGRNAQLGDVFIDSMGIAMGLAFLWATRIFSCSTGN